MSSSPAAAHLVDDDVLTEILLLLPPVSVLRSRAVCKRWRRITTCPAFLAAYSRRRPLELLVYPEGYNMRPGAKSDIAGVDPLDDGGYIRRYRRFLRQDRSLRLVDSRDGLLLLLELRSRSFLFCNPATRQLASLRSPAPDPCMSVMASGLYFHQPSGEHRVLCIGHVPPRGYKYDPASRCYCRRQAQAPPDAGAEEGEGRDFHCVLSAGGAEPRRLGPVAAGSSVLIPGACVALGGALYWADHPEAGDSGDMVAFDTASETFRRIPAPPLGAGTRHRHHLRAFDMEGTLAVSAVEERSLRMDVWVLEAGGAGETTTTAWARRLRIDLPPRGFMDFVQPSDEAVAVLEGGLLVVVGAGWVSLYDVKAKRTVSRTDHRRTRNVNRSLYRASLVQLPEQPHAQPPPLPCLDDGKPPLHYWSPDHPLHVLPFARSCQMWMLGGLEYGCV